MSETHENVSSFPFPDGEFTIFSDQDDWSVDCGAEELSDYAWVHEQMGIGDLPTRSPGGFDRLFICEQHLVRMEVVGCRLNEVDFHLMYNQKRVFLHNKNLHLVPRRLAGLLIFVETNHESHQGYIGVICSACGFKAIVKPLLPSPSPVTLINLRNETGFYVQQVWGPMSQVSLNIFAREVIYS